MNAKASMSLQICLQPQQHKKTHSFHTTASSQATVAIQGFFASFHLQVVSKVPEHAMSSNISHACSAGYQHLSSYLG